jgi:hypothetical protein
MSSRQRKREWHEVLAVEKAPPSFLDWSDDAITFSREDHPNRIPNPGQYPLVVDPVIGNARFSKVLMDGDSSLNILYAHTLRLLGFGLDQLRPCYAKFMAVPNYTHLKVKMPGPNSVITVGSSIEHAFDCDVKCVEHAEALALDEALVANLEKLVNEDLDSAAKHAGSFEAAEQTKEVPLDPTAPEGKALRVSSTLNPK